jgi:hypothetical protein
MGIGGVAMLAVSSPRDAGHFAAVPVTLMIGTLWMANVLMVMAPFCLSRIERGVTKGGLLAGLLSLFSVEASILFMTVDEAIPGFLRGTTSGSFRFFALRSCFLCSS